MSWKLDEIIQHPDGSQVWIRYGRYPRLDGTQTLMIKVKNPQGQTIELWHVVRDSQGNELHRERKPIRR